MYCAYRIPVSEVRTPEVLSLLLNLLFIFPSFRNELAWRERPSEVERKRTGPLYVVDELLPLFRFARPITREGRHRSPNGLLH